MIGRSVPREYEYEPRIMSGVGSRLQCLHERAQATWEDIQHAHEHPHVHAWKTALCSKVHRVLVEEFGVAARVSVWKQIRYARFDVPRGNIKRKAGYMVARIRDRWGRPAGYEPDEESRGIRRRSMSCTSSSRAIWVREQRRGEGWSWGTRGASVVGSISLWRAR